MAKIEGRARELLEDPKNFVKLTTLEEDGDPFSVVIWADLENGHVAVNSSEGRKWPENVRRNPRVELVVPNWDNPYEYVRIHGRVVEDTHDGADEHINRLAKKYLGQDEYPYRQEGEQRVIIKVAPEKITHNNPG
jgi:PPOX class probable F420-dependent enzyme